MDFDVCILEFIYRKLLTKLLIMKRTITIVVVILLAVGIGYWLFKISPKQDQSVGQYNSALNVSSFKEIATPPAFDPATDHYVGNKDAKNVFIEYGDMQCPGCAAYNEMLKDVPKQFDDTVLVFRYFPLVQIHANSVESALANEAAGAQGKYWEMHDLLFQKQTDWEGLSDPLDTFAQYAQQVGVTNSTQFRDDVTSKKYLSTIQKDSDEALGLKLPGTPSFFFNGHLLPGQEDVAGLKKQAEPYLNK